MSEYTVQGRLINNFTYSSILHELSPVSPKANMVGVYHRLYVYFCVIIVSYNEIRDHNSLPTYKCCIYSHSIRTDLGSSMVTMHFLNPDKY